MSVDIVAEVRVTRGSGLALWVANCRDGNIFRTRRGCKRARPALWLKKNTVLKSKPLPDKVSAAPHQ
jgi:hypothetical protein